jgi:hypothetical protein
MSIEPLETAEGSEFPLVRQVSVFLENRLGQLLRLTKLFDHSEVHILAVSVEGSIDCAIVRIIVDDPDTAHDMLREAGFAISETELLVVELPAGKRGMMTVCAALIAAEVNINYTYALLPGGNRGACIAIQVDNPSVAAATLTGRKFRVLDQSQLRE